MKLSFTTIFSIFLIILILLAGGTSVVLAANDNSGLPNPIGPSDMTMMDLWIRVMEIILGATGVFALVMFIYGGLTMMTSGGNPDRVKKAKDTLVWAILGLATIILSGAVIRYVFESFRF